MSGDSLNKDFIDKYNSVGQQRFYRFLLTYAINKLIKISNGDYRGISSPEIDFLEYAKRFLQLSRREGNESYLDMSKIFRKAAHKIYRVMLKKQMTERNIKFLNLV